MSGSQVFYPSLFRVLIATLLIVDAISGWVYKDALYQLDHFQYAWDVYLPWLGGLRANVAIFLFFYIGLLVVWLCGFGKHLTSLLVYILFILDFFLLYPAVFWGDYILRITLFFFVFVDSFHFFAVKPFKQNSGLIHRLAIWSIMLNLCWVYIDNAYFKLNNTEWTSGYALAYFFEFSKPWDILRIGDFMLQFPLCIKLATWLVLIFQCTMPLAIWVKRLKWWWIAAGILIHLLMAVTLQLYKFELIMILLYGFFITDKEWQFIFDRLNIKLEILHGKR